jgi:rSAM/selenodomain-associated transferase 2
MRVSVIIPTLNEEATVGAAIDSARAASVAEIIVADGGSSDATVNIARDRGVVVIEGEKMRARQMNRGAAAATGDALIFLHADTILPNGAPEAVRAAVESGSIFGGFRIAFLEPGLGFVAWAINTRTWLTRAPWGDQAQFARRDVFQHLGGFREIPIMEDYELAARMKREGRTTLLPFTVITSGRRFLQKGIVRTSTLNWLIITAYHLGVSPERLARWYRT